MSNIPLAHAVIVGPSIGGSSMPSASSLLVNPINDQATKDFLSFHGWPVGLQDSCIAGMKKSPVRFIIVDDSGSMSENDGNLMVGKGNQIRTVKCSRWTELGDAIKFHAKLAEVACAPTEFRLLNGSNPLMLGLGPEKDSVNLNQLNICLDQSPGGGTPLCRHITEIINQIRGMEGQLRSSGQKAVLVICTDGESSDGDVASAMRPLQTLPVWVVIRLCTDNKRICDYWNNIDAQLELEIDVLDDISSEAEEVYRVNPWLTYGEPLHRLREFGVAVREMDMLDECTLTSEQMRTVVAMILGGRKEDVPRPEIEWEVFSTRMQSLLNESPQIFDPYKKKLRPWIDMHGLKNKYGPAGKCIIT